MPSIDTANALLVLLGLLAMTNSLWLLPGAGDARYTYEPTEVEVDDGRLEYDGRTHPEFYEYNDLGGVDCQLADPKDRACALDAHIVADGPVTVDGYGTNNPFPRYESDGERFVEVDGAYYRRVSSETTTTGTYDLERLSASDLLAETARNVTGMSEPTFPSNDVSPSGIVVRGEAITTTERPDSVNPGSVFLRDGDYYTVVLTERAPANDLLDRRGRNGLLIAGSLVLVWGIAREFAARDS